LRTTSSSKAASTKFSLCLPKGYAIAAKEIFELNPVRMVFHYLQNNQRQETTRNPKQLDEALKIVQEVAADIRASHFPAKEAFICRSCAYKPICPAHEERLLT
jgi:CRISPR/Cas system-associated exonuclease Cas4 (RecB family)